MMAAPEFILAEIVVVIMGLTVLAITALSYMRSVNALADLIRREKPGFWPGYYAWFFWLLSGVSNLEMNDPRYPGLLKHARRRMVLLFLVFVVVIIAIGWFSHGA